MTRSSAFLSRAASNAQLRRGSSVFNKLLSTIETVLPDVFQHCRRQHLLHRLPAPNPFPNLRGRNRVGECTIQVTTTMRVRRNRVSVVDHTDQPEKRVGDSQGQLTLVERRGMPGPPRRMGSRCGRSRPRLFPGHFRWCRRDPVPQRLCWRCRNGWPRCRRAGPVRSS